MEKTQSMEVENMVYNLANTIEELQRKAEEKGIIKVAKSALEKGADIDFVIKITGLAAELVKKLKEEL